MAKGGCLWFGGPGKAGSSPGPGAGAESERMLVTFEMLKRGPILERNGKKIRQCSVMVRGSVRLVTSGDWVEPDIYQALIETNALEPPASRDVPPGDDAPREQHEDSGDGRETG